MRDDAVDVALKIAGSIVRPLVYTTLSLPAVIVVASSFTAGDDLRFPPEGFSPRWYMAAFKSDMFMGSLWTSTKLAFVTMVLSLTLGMAAAFAIDRRSFPGKHAFRTLTLSPLIVPMVVLGLGLLQFLAWMRLNQSFLGLLIGHVLITLPYVVRTLNAGMVLFDRTLEQAAMNSSRTAVYSFSENHAPASRPGVRLCGRLCVCHIVRQYHALDLSWLCGGNDAAGADLRLCRTQLRSGACGSLDACDRRHARDDRDC